MSAFIDPLIAIGKKLGTSLLNSEAGKLGKESVTQLMRTVGQNEKDAIIKMAPNMGKKLWEVVEPMKSQQELSFTEKHGKRLMDGLVKTGKEDLAKLNQFRDTGNINHLTPELANVIGAEAPHIAQTRAELAAIGKDSYQARRLLDNVDVNSGLPKFQRDNSHTVNDLGLFYKQAEEVLHQHKTLGPKDEVPIGLLKELQNEIASSGRDSKLANADRLFAQNSIERYLGRNLHNINVNGLSDPLESKGLVERAINGYMAGTNLSLAGFRHGGQLASSMLVNESYFQNGLKPLFTAVAEMVKDPQAAKDFAIGSGADIYHTLRSTELEHLGDLAKKVGTGDVTRMGDLVSRVTLNDRFAQQRRTFDAIVGKKSAEQAFQKLLKNPGDKEARRFLQNMFVDPDQTLKQGSLSQQQLMMVGKRMSDIVNFRGDATSLPSMMLGNRFGALGRTLSTFRRMQFQAGKFTKDYVIAPALKGNFRPLMYAGMIFPMVGEVAADLHSIVTHGDMSERPGDNLASVDKVKRFWIDRYIDSLTHALPLGLMYDMVISIGHGTMASAFNFLGGPVEKEGAQDLLIGWNLATNRKQGMKQLKEKVVHAVPVAGPYLYHKMTDKKSKGLLERGEVTRLFNKTVQKGIDVFGEMAKSSSQQ